MKIYSMTATFGKLEHQTLALQPGLNIIQAPNEWGKSTWCAFLVAMLYGIDTRERSTQDALAQKERYAPWSGSPMAGRIDLNYDGRDITIERGSKGRNVFGIFRAYETASGLDIPELTAANCGQILLGVEKSVFTRAGFLRLTDLPVTQDEALRRRLNALVTTGDESGSSDLLEKKLKELKNQCMSNRSNGMIPKLEARQKELEAQLQNLQLLQDQEQKLRKRQKQLEDHQASLMNHKAALEYSAAASAAQKAEEATAALETAGSTLRHWQHICDPLPPREEAEQALRQLKEAQQASASLQMEACMLPGAPKTPKPPAFMTGKSVSDALSAVRQDAKRYARCSGAGSSLYTLLPGGLFLAGGIVLWMLVSPLWAVICLALGLIGMIAFPIIRHRQRRSQAALDAKYQSLPPERWEAAVQQYAAAYKDFEAALTQFEQSQSEFTARRDEILAQIRQLTDGEDITVCQSRWQRILDSYSALEDAQRQYRMAASHAQVFCSLQKSVQPPRMPDTMTYSEEETNRLLSDCGVQLRQLQSQLGHCQGQMAAMGQEGALRLQLQQTCTRLSRLKDTYAALEIAQQTAQEANRQLQRRFAPQISRHTREIFCRLTGGRYDRLTLDEELHLHTAAQEEDLLHNALWRSDGTADQLYFALRLAVAQALIPDAPLILDDALVRFDDKRLKKAMEVLQEEASNKQVILFTCQGREKRCADN